MNYCNSTAIKYEHRCRFFTNFLTINSLVIKIVLNIENSKNYLNLPEIKVKMQKS